MRRRTYLRTVVASGAVVAGVGVNVTGSVVQIVQAQTNSEWNQQAKLIPDDGDDNDLFGESVALDGDTALISAVTDQDPNGVFAGSAYIFERDSDGWAQQAKLAADDGDDFDVFGASVAVDGDTALIGALQHEGPSGGGAGSAYIFERDSDGWTQRNKLTPDDGDEDDRFGFMTALDGDTALVGARRDEDPNGDIAGSAYIFERDSDGWAQQAKLAADDGDVDDEFGASVALDGDTALIGARSDENPNGNNAGSAYIFVRDSDGWTQQTKLAPGDGDSGDEFGVAGALDGDTALIGARSDEDPNGNNAGSAYIFVRGSDGWAQQAKLAADDGDDGDNFGFEVALDGNTALIGAPEDEDPNGPESGSAYVFASDPYTEYTDETGRVDTEGLREAIDDWREDEIDTNLLREVIGVWRTGEQVG